MQRCLAVFVVTLGLGGCADRFAQEEKDVARSVNCATAEGDIRVLESEKAHVGQEMASGVFTFVPAAIVYGVATGTEGERLEVAGGEYNEKIETKIAEIKSTCDV